MPPGKIVFVMPRCRHDHVRAAHKQAYSLSRAGYDVTLVVKESLVDEYLGMRVVAARAPFKSVFRPLLNLPLLFRQVRRMNADLYVLRNPDTIPLALVLRLLGEKVIYDTHEDFSKRPLMHDALPTWSRPAVAWLITQLERLLARTTVGVLVTQSQQVIGLGGRTMLQPNAPLITGPIVEGAGESDNVTRQDELVFVYIGEITRLRGLFTMLNLIQRVNTERSATLRLIGWIRSAELESVARQHPGWQYVDYSGHLSHSETLRAIKRCDVGLALLQPVADIPSTSVTKLFEYMHSGIPFIASDFDAWRVATDLGPPGMYVNPDCADEIAAAALHLAVDPALRQRMGAAGRLHINSGFNWERVADPFLQLVRKQLRGSVTP